MKNGVLDYQMQAQGTTTHYLVLVRTLSDDIPVALYPNRGQAEAHARGLRDAFRQRSDRSEATKTIVAIAGRLGFQAAEFSCVTVIQFQNAEPVSMDFFTDE